MECLSEIETAFAKADVPALIDIILDYRGIYLAPTNPIVFDDDHPPPDIDTSARSVL